MNRSRTASSEGFARLVVDCSQLEFCDSTGLNVLLGARLKAEAAGGGVHLAGMLPVVARVFEITGAEAVFTVHDSLEAALADVIAVGLERRECRSDVPSSRYARCRVDALSRHSVRTESVGVLTVRPGRRHPDMNADGKRRQSGS